MNGVFRDFKVAFVSSTSFFMFEEDDSKNILLHCYGVQKFIIVYWNVAFFARK